MPVEQTDLRRAGRAFAAWVSSHPDPDRVLFRTLEGEELTPRRLALEVRHRTRLGVDQVEALQDLAGELDMPFGDVLLQMTRHPEVAF